MHPIKVSVNSIDCFKTCIAGDTAGGPVQRAGERSQRGLARARRGQVRQLPDQVWRGLRLSYMNILVPNLV